MERDNFDPIDVTNATHKLMPLYTRDLGEDADKHNAYIPYFDTKRKKIINVQNYISYRIQNFNVMEMGDLKHLINMKENKMKITKTIPDSQRVELIDE